MNRRERLRWFFKKLLPEPVFDFFFDFLFGLLWEMRWFAVFFSVTGGTALWLWDEHDRHEADRFRKTMDVAAVRAAAEDVSKRAAFEDCARLGGAPVMGFGPSVACVVSSSSVRYYYLAEPPRTARDASGRELGPAASAAP